MFATATILIDRSTDDVYDVLSKLRTQVPLWEVFFVPGLEDLDENTIEANCFYQSGVNPLECVIGLHLTRPGAGLVTRVQTAIGELAAEWRIMEETGRTRVEVNIEGRGSGPTSNISIRQLAPKILARLKAHFDRS